MMMSFSYSQTSENTHRPPLLAGLALRNAMSRKYSKTNFEIYL